VSNRTRAVVIGLLGPAVSVLGLLWTLADAAAGSVETANLRYFLFDSPHLVIAMGVVLSFLCVPIAIEVARAQPEEVELPVFDAGIDEEEETPADGAPDGLPGPYGLSPK
jgi:hypothetical protein